MFTASARVFRFKLYLLMLGLGLALAVNSQTAGLHQSVVYRVDIDGVINPGAARLLQYGIDRAAENGAAALIVRIDTPGGLLSSTRDMVSAIAESPVPVISYVGPSGASATSAGAFILLASHVAVMNSGSNVGASSPVSGGGGEIEGTMGRKVLNDTRAFMRSIADSRGRNAEVAERFVTEAESLTATEAREQQIVDLVVNSQAELLSALEGYTLEWEGEQRSLQLAGAELREVSPRMVDRFLQLVAHPQIAHMLISLGFLAIYIEVMSPGLAFPGVFGSMAVVLGLVGVQTLPVNIGFLLLLLMGLGLMLAEFFVAGFGVLGIGGAVAFVLGSLNLFDTPLSDQSHSTIRWISIGVSAAVLVAALLVSRSVLFAPRKAINLVGKSGEAMVNFDGQGYVLVEDQRWPAQSEEPIQHGDPIVVIEQRGELLVVSKR